MRKKGLSTHVRLLLVLALTASPLTAQAKPDNPASETVTISGLVEKPFTITTASIKLMKTAEQKNSAIVCVFR